MVRRNNYVTFKYSYEVEPYALLFMKCRNKLLNQATMNCPSQLQKRLPLPSNNIHKSSILITLKITVISEKDLCPKTEYRHDFLTTSPHSTMYSIKPMLPKHEH